MPEPENKSAEEGTVEKYEWMIRPCAVYIDEYTDCKSIKARFHQYFIHGETTDCSQWKTDYNNCHLWERHKSQEAFDKLIESEKIRRFERLKGHCANDVWEKRDKPPENWNAPLPKWVEERNATSQLVLIRDRIKETGKPPKMTMNSCTIM